MLDLVLGAPYMITKNMDTANGIANGSQCTLVDVLIDDKKDVHFQQFPESSGVQGGSLHCIDALHAWIDLSTYQQEVYKKDHLPKPW